MRHEIGEWVGMDADRRRIYQTEPIYHAQARILSDLIDAVEVSLQVSGIPERDRQHAVQSAVVAVLGSIEAAEQRLLDTQTRVRLAEHAAVPRPPGHEGGWWSR